MRSTFERMTPRLVEVALTQLPEDDSTSPDHGWWQQCADAGLPGYPPFGPDSANLNLILRQGPSDPISGSSPLRATLCGLTPAGRG